MVNVAVSPVSVTAATVAPGATGYRLYPSPIGVTTSTVAIKPRVSVAVPPVGITSSSVLMSQSGGDLPVSAVDLASGTTAPAILTRDVAIAGDVIQLADALRVGLGSSISPSVSIGEATLGFYRKSAGVIGVAGTLDFDSDDIIVDTIQIGDGTSGAPSLAFESDTDTGIYKFADNRMGITGGGAARLLTGTGSGGIGVKEGVLSQPGLHAFNDSNTGILFNLSGSASLVSDGAVTATWDGTGFGIGTTTPGVQLHIYDTAQVDLQLQADYLNGKAQVKLLNDVQEWHLRLDGSDNLVFRDQTALASPMTIESGSAEDSIYVTSTGVGVGTAPDKPLHVYHETINEILRIESGDGTAGLLLTDPDGTSRIRRTSVGLGLEHVNTTAQLIVSDGIGVRIENGATAAPDDLLHVSAIGSTNAFRIDDTLGTASFGGAPAGYNTLTVADLGSGAQIKAVGVASKWPFWYSHGTQTSGSGFFVAADGNESDLRLRNASNTQVVKLNTLGDSYLLGGDFGIGTSTPSAPLHVIADAANVDIVRVENTLGFAVFDVLNDASGKGYARVWDESGTVKIQLHSSGDSYFDGGEFGIGTTSPSELFHVSTAGSADAIRIDDALGTVGINQTPNASPQLSVTGGIQTRLDGAGATRVFRVMNQTAAAAGTGPYIDWAGQSGTPMASVYARWDGAATTDAYMAFHTRGSDTQAERVRLTSTGRLGIGTTTPGEMLDVAGNIAVSGTVDDVDVADLDSAYTSHAADSTIHFTVGSLSSTYLPLAGGTMSGVLDMGSQDIDNVLGIGIGKAAGAYAIDIVDPGIPNIRISDVDTDATTKLSYIGSRHYTNVEQAMGLVYGQSKITSSILSLGGGSSAVNAITEGRLYAAANTITTGGTEMVRWTTAGLRVEDGVSAAASDLFHVAATGNANALRIDDGTGVTGIGATPTAAYGLTVGTGGTGHVFAANAVTGDWPLCFNYTGAGAASGFQISADNAAISMRDATNTIAVFIDTSGDSYLLGGDLGIGISGPTAPLHVQSSAANSDVIRVRNQTGFDIFEVTESTGGQAYVDVKDETAVVQARISGAGANYFLQDVGIGTSAPARALDIVDSSANMLRMRTNETDLTSKFGLITVGHYTNAEQDVALVYSVSGSSYNTLYLGGGNASVNAIKTGRLFAAADGVTLNGTEMLRWSTTGVRIEAAISASPGQLFQVSATGNDTALVVKETTGYVGIGTNTPAEAFDVVGNIAVSGTVDGVDIAALDTAYTSHAADSTIHFTTASLSSTYLPLAGGTMSGDIDLGDNDLVNVGQIGVNWPTPGYAIDIADEQSIRIGCDQAADGARTDALVKIGRIVGVHYTAAEDDISLLRYYSSAGGTSLSYGGGSTAENEITTHTWYVGADNVTLGSTASEMMELTSSGLGVLRNPASGYAVSAASGGTAAYGAFNIPDADYALGFTYTGATTLSGFQVLSSEAAVTLRDSTNANTVMIRAGGAGDSYIDNGGDLGLGTSSPGDLFHVSATGEANALRISDVDGSVGFGAAPGGSYRITASAADMSSGGIYVPSVDTGDWAYVFTGGTMTSGSGLEMVGANETALTLRNASNAVTVSLNSSGSSSFTGGNVGIGGSPSDLFHVSTAGAANAIRTDDALGGTGFNRLPAGGWTVSAASLGSGAFRASDVPNDDYAYGFTYTGSASSSGFAVTGNNAEMQLRDATNTKTVHIDTSGNSYLTGGNVGIGTSSPAEALSVVGNVTATGTFNTVDVGAIPTTYLPLAGGTMTGPLNMGSQDLDSVGALGVGGASSAFAVDIVGATTPQIRGTNVTTDVTNKQFLVAVREYQGSRDDAAMLMGKAQSAANTLSLGGGNAALEAMTSVHTYAAAAVGTATGTEMSRLTTDGLRVESAVSADADYLFHVSATGDNVALVVDDTLGHVAICAAPDANYALKMTPNAGVAGMFVNSLESDKWAYVFSGGTNNGSGLKQYGANGTELTLKDGTTETISLRSNDTSFINGGDFGVGAAPSDLFHVSTAGDADALRVDDTLGHLGMGVAPNASYILRMTPNAGIAGIWLGPVDADKWTFVHTGGTNTGSGLKSLGANGAELSLRDGATETVQITSTTADSFISQGDFGLGVTNPAYKLDIVDGGNGQPCIVMSDNEGDAVAKSGRIYTRHYTEAEEPAMVFAMDTSSGSNVLHLGGGKAGANSATVGKLYAGANVTTTTGTEMSRWTTDGIRIEDGVSGNASDLFQVSTAGDANALQVSDSLGTVALRRAPVADIPLVVKAAIATGDAIRVYNTGSSTRAAIGLDAGNDHGYLALRDTGAVITAKLRGTGDSYILGELGLGTSAPSDLFHVSTTGNTNSIRVTDSTGHVGLGVAPHASYFCFIDGTGSTGSLYTKGSKVLHVVDGADQQEALTIRNTTTAATGLGPVMAWRGEGDYAMAHLRAAWDGASTNDANLRFATRSGAAFAERMRLTSDGKLGIGTTSPAQALDVAGSIAVSGTVDGVDVAGHAADSDLHFTEGSIDHGALAGLTDASDHPQYLMHNGTVAMTGDLDLSTSDIVDVGNIGIGVAAPGIPLQIKSAATDIIAVQNNPGFSIWEVSQDGSGHGYMTVKDSTDTTKVQLSATGTKENYILGNVGIGGATPSEKLDVTGNIAVSGTVDGVDIAAIATTYLPLAGGTMTGDIDMGAQDIKNATFVGVGTASPGRTVDIISTGATQLRVSNTETDATAKACRIGMRHYTAAEQDALLVYGYSASGYNTLYLGGGNGSNNTVTTGRLFAAADGITLTGTEMLRWSTAGVRVQSGVSASAAYLLDVSTTADAAAFRVDDALGTIGISTSPSSATQVICAPQTGYSAYTAWSVGASKWGFNMSNGTATYGSGFIVAADVNECAMVMRDATNSIVNNFASSGASYITGGDFGVGASPSDLFHVTATGNANALRIDDTWGTTGFAIAPTSTYTISMGDLGTAGTIRASALSAATWPFVYTHGTQNIGSGFYIAASGNESDMRLRNASATVAVLLNSNGDSYINGGEFVVGSNSAADLFHVSATGAADAFRIDDTTGTIGINRTPISGVPVSIKSTGTSTDPLRVYNSSGGSIIDLSEDGDGDGYVDVKNSAGTTTTRLYANGASYFDGGNVGIGATTASDLLHVTTTGDANAFRIDDTFGTVGFSQLPLDGYMVSAKSAGTAAFLANDVPDGDWAYTFDYTGASLCGFIISGTNAQMRLDDASSVETVRLNTAGDSWLKGGELGIGTSTPGCLLQVEADIGNSPADASSIGAVNSAAAVANVTGDDGQSYSPSVRWEGQGWKTDATAASQKVEFRAFAKPVQGAAAPTGEWVFQSSINNAAYNDPLFRISSDGEFGLNNSHHNGVTLTLKGKNTSADMFRALNTAGVSVIDMTLDASDDGYLDVKDAGGTIKNRIYSSGASYITGGEFGIGTTGPADLFHVSATGDADAFRVDDATGCLGAGGIPVSAYTLTAYSGGAGTFLAKDIPADDWAYGITYTGATSHSGFKVSGTDLELRMVDSSNSETVRLDTAGDSWLTGGDLGIGTSSPARALDLVGSSFRMRTSEADLTTKSAYLMLGHYTNAEQDITLVHGSSGSSYSTVEIGGYSGSANVAKTGKLWAAPDTITTVGTEMLRWATGGVRIEAGVSAGASDLFHVAATGSADAFRIDDTTADVGIGTAPVAGYRLNITDTTAAQVRINTATTNGTAHLFWSNDAKTWRAGVGGSDHWGLYDGDAGETRVLVHASTGRMAVGSDGTVEATTAATMHVQQLSTTAAVPVLELQQDDDDDEFIEFDGAEAANGTNCVSTRTISGAVTKHVKVSVNGTVGWIAITDTPQSGG